MSGGHAVAKLYFNCGHCGVALSDGAFTCDKMLSTNERCQHLLCESCARYHENYFNHDIFRARNLDYIISTGTFVCTFEGCARDIPAPLYSQHQRMCPYKILTCPVCNDGFALISLRTHFLREHQFNHYQLNYGYLNTSHNISNDRRYIFSGRRLTLCSSLQAQPFILYGLVHQLLLHLKRLLLHQRLQICN
ncbi:hypothetical protein PVAP13_7NG089978 [Panicum virgatum]|uniref:Uncharacterized protein n=1 Tax=Panicum virgatum TaxID=38727 RepID=A0A8T0PQ95_PANVG|nr:hypothetical protein PVAP13_7NG089978 [Panicum virgatum]